MKSPNPVHFNPTWPRLLAALLAVAMGLMLLVWLYIWGVPPLREHLLRKSYRVGWMAVSGVGICAGLVAAIGIWGWATALSGYLRTSEEPQLELSARRGTWAAIGLAVCALAGAVSVYNFNQYLIN